MMVGSPIHKDLERVPFARKKPVKSQLTMIFT